MSAATGTPSSASWLTAKRLRAHGLMIGLALWSTYLWSVGTSGLYDRWGNLKGTDFVHLYTLGSLAAEHRGADLYDMNAQAVLAAQRVPQAAGIPYLPLYPPQLSILFLPLAHLSYAWALALWWACTALVYGICCYSIWRTCLNLRGEGGTVAILAIAYPAFFHLIAWGQTSALALAFFSLMFFTLRARRGFLAGLILGCLIFKPQLGLAAAVVFVSVGAWKTVAGAVLSAVSQLAVGALYYGIQPLREWLHTLANVRTVMPWLEPKPYQTYSLRTFWSMLVPWPDFAFGLYVVSAIVVLGLTIVLWKQAVPLSLRFSALLLSTVLVAPHLTVYDLVILAPAFLLLADWMAGQVGASSHRWLGSLLYMVYALPLLGPAARWTHLQLSVIAMAATVCVIWRVGGRPGPTLTAQP